MWRCAKAETAGPVLVRGWAGLVVASAGSWPASVMMAAAWGVLVVMVPPDGDLVHVLVVEQLYVECLVEGGLDAFGQLAEVPGDQRDDAEEFGVVVTGGGVVDAGDLGFDLLALGVQFGEPLG
jgi:hypothetical protein